jgi:DNA polymerase III delta prime subunit
MGEMVVNKTPATMATPVSLNFEAVNPFDVQDDEFGTVQTPQYDIVQTWLSYTNPMYTNAGRADIALRSYLGNAQIIDRLPDRLIEDPNNPGHAMPGEAHKPHQKCGLYWAITMERTLKRGICADGCGTGKSHAIRAHIQGAYLYWARQASPATEPTLVVVPKNLVDKTYDELSDGMGADWHVYRYGQSVGSLPLLFDRTHSVYKSLNAGKTVVVVSLTEVQHAKAFESTHEGMFVRIIVDEAQAIRRCDLTIQGRILKSFKARYRFLYTGSLVVDTMKDIDGYLAFLEDEEWSDPRDRNLVTANESHRSRYGEYIASLEDSEGPSLGPSSSNFSTPTQGWDLDCESVKDLHEDDVQRKIGDGWLCSHFPAGLRFNRNRAASLTRNAPKKRGKKKQQQSKVTPPFEENPYDTFHRSNPNKIRCLTTAAFRYWIRDHLSQTEITDASKAIVARRVKKIFEILILSRNLQSKVTKEDGTIAIVGEDLPTISIDTQNFRFLPGELEAYNERAEQCATAVISDIANADFSQLEMAANNGTSGIGSKFSKLSVLCTHLGLSAFNRVPTDQIRKLQPEGLPMLAARMKAAKALNPDDIDIPMKSDEEVLRQFLWGSPKMRFLLWEIQRVILGNDRPRSHRKIFATFQWPSASQMCLQVCCLLATYNHILTRYSWSNSWASKLPFSIAPWMEKPGTVPSENLTLATSPNYS